MVKRICLRWTEIEMRQYSTDHKLKKKKKYSFTQHLSFELRRRRRIYGEV